MEMSIMHHAYRHPKDERHSTLYKYIFIKVFLIAISWPRFMLRKQLKTDI